MKGIRLSCGSRKRKWSWHRPAKKVVGGRKWEKPGRALKVRLIVMDVREDLRSVLSRWMLLTNAPESWSAAGLLARCDSWCWGIESYSNSKLLESDGQQGECWRQQTRAAIARRLFVASMACVVVWQLQAGPSAEATDVITLAGEAERSTDEADRPFTAPALLVGLWVLLAAREALRDLNPDELTRCLALIPFLGARGEKHAWIPMPQKIGTPRLASRNVGGLWHGRRPGRPDRPQSVSRLSESILYASSEVPVHGHPFSLERHSSLLTPQCAGVSARNQRNSPTLIVCVSEGH